MLQKFTGYKKSMLSQLLRQLIKLNAFEVRYRKPFVFSTKIRKPPISFKEFKTLFNNMGNNHGAKKIKERN